MSIPKIIHYCWFGRKPKPKLAEKCIRSWKKYCPDYEIVEWNEDNFDVSSAPVYVQQAYEAGRWAFVTDYVRLLGMLKMGGVYMDTDVEVVKSLDPYLRHRAFAGFEADDRIQTGLMACEAGFPLFEEFLHHYDDASFLNPDGSANVTTNVTVLTNLCRKYGLVPNGKHQTVEGLALYPKDVFCPVDFDTEKLHRTRNTVTIHWFASSWKTEEERQELESERRRLREEKIAYARYDFLTGLLGKENYEKLKAMIKGR